MEKNDLSILKKLSNREDIENLYNTIGVNLRKKVILDSYYLEKSLKSDWDLLRANKVRSTVGYYKSIIAPYVSSLHDYIKTDPIFFEVNKFKKEFENYMGVMVSQMSDLIFKAEIRNYLNDETLFFLQLSENFLFFNDLVRKYIFWYSSVKKILEQTHDFLLEFLKQLKKSRKKVTTLFFDKDSKITNIFLSKGDRHNDKFVIECETEEGNFFFKPRRGELIKSFEIFLNKLSKNNKILPMMSEKIIDCGNNYWVRKVDFKSIDPSNVESIQNYYRRLGQFDAVFYILNGSDIHYENIISSGEHPVVIDIETLLSSRLLLKKSVISPFFSRNEIIYSLDTVRNSMILPDILTLKNKLLNISPFNIIDNIDGEEKIDKNKLHPIFREDLSTVMEDVKDGFATVYKEILENKQDYRTLLTSIFKDIKIRYLNRPTETYSQISRLLTNPVCYLDFKYAFAVSSRLYDFKDISKISSEEIVEQIDLLNFNIPYFEVKSDSKKLITSNGVIEGYFAESPLESLNFKLNILSNLDLDRQNKLIEYMFFVISPKFSVNEIENVKNINKFSNYSYTKEEIRISVNRMVADLLNKKIVNPISNQYFWMGPELEGSLKSKVARYKMIDYPNTCYSGNVGILITLLNLKDKHKYKNTIKHLISDVNTDINAIINFNLNRGANIGSYNGIAQYIRCYIALYEAGEIDIENYSFEINELLNQLLLSISEDQKLDILDGSAGVALEMLELEKVEKLNVVIKDKIKKILIKCREHLMGSIVKDRDFYYFPLEQDKSRYFTGFAHGSSGIIMALYKINKYLNFEDDVLIEKLLQTERYYFDSSKEVWYRGNKTQEYSWGWCHGIPGILLSRVELYNAGYDNRKLLEEIKKLYEITYQKSLGTNFTFCHGDLGNILILMHTENCLGYKHNRTKEYLNSILPYLLRADLYHIRGVESTGLMNGIAGVIAFLNGVYKNEFDPLLKILKIS